MKTPLSAVTVSCTLKPSPAASSSDLTLSPGVQKDLEETPERVASAISTAARTAAHLTQALKAQEYPAG